jgi:hypothetical protein
MKKSFFNWIQHVNNQYKEFETFDQVSRNFSLKYFCPDNFYSNYFYSSNNWTTLAQTTIVTSNVY